MVRSAPTIRVYYDEEFDVLEIFFHEPVPTVAMEIIEDVFVHVVPRERKTVGMTIHRFREKHRHYNLPFEGTLRPSNPDLEERLARIPLPA